MIIRILIIINSHVHIFYIYQIEEVVYMNKPLFKNIVMILQNKEKALAFLENPNNILKWDSDIAWIAEQQNGLKISRSHQSLNDNEVMTVERNGDQVIYYNKGNHLNYQVVFELIEENGHLEIAETLLFPEKANSSLPIKLLKPVAKHAFAAKLDDLATALEQL